MNRVLRKGKLFIITTSRPTAGGWINPGNHLLRVGGRMQQGKRNWNLYARCSLYVPLGSDEKGYPIQHEHPGFGIESHEIMESVPVEEYVAKNAAGQDIHWCRISSRQVAELSGIFTKRIDLLENEILGFAPKTHKQVPTKRRGCPRKNADRD